MKKIYSLLIALCLFATMLNASTVETTLWEGTYTDGIEINSATIATFNAGDILRVYVTVPQDGANFKIVYKGAPDWSETTIPSIGNQWPWVNGGETYKEFVLTQADLTALDGKNIYIYQGENSTIVRVSLLTEETDTQETTLWEGTYTDGIEINSATIATFNADDILRVYVTVPQGGANFKIVYKGAPDWSETTIPSIGNQWPWVNGGETYKEFVLTQADLTALDGKNIYIYQGENSTITKVSLLSEDHGSSTGLYDVPNDRVQGTKVIEKGVLYLIYRGIKYNVQGQIIK
ncbi:MAG: hypothetical protein IJU36_05305 [Paludibacteraceae bacterium]|nr:hypothetical protein [Paludibacteraceae bacterium]